MKLRAEKIIDGIPINPVLPKRFWDTDNQRRPASHHPWWFLPFVITGPNEAWAGGVRFDTWCLDGGAWDRPTCWGKFGTLEEAVQCAQEGPAWRRREGCP
ncbi:hypothetical protein [Mesoterricola silvestris]|uniref:Uncharacterized protein n=1 Tax=Mesoterricola silvestris TaxID=2927979 RepID=A0AA48H2N3_9BACT|nr:hypothetical protein [Mesoterricola silvestris]BDU74893.1 hypothetical protein METEAL_40670 [Mesoterricola silvestris]